MLDTLAPRKTSSWQLQNQVAGLLPPSEHARYAWFGTKGPRSVSYLSLGLVICSASIVAAIAAFDFSFWLRFAIGFVVGCVLIFAIRRLLEKLTKSQRLIIVVTDSKKVFTFGVPLRSDSPIVPLGEAIELPEMIGPFEGIGFYDSIDNQKIWVSAMHYDEIEAASRFLL